MDPNGSVTITGGDRYVDADGNVKPSTTGDIIPGAHPNGHHNYGQAVDFSVSTTATSAQIEQAARDAGFTRYADGYSDGHIHVGG